MDVRGRNLIEGIPKTITISDDEVREALADSVSTIVNAVRVALERTPPELSADIVERGIVMTGGGALLKNLDRRLSIETGLPVSVADDPLSSVVLGAGKMLSDFNLLKRVKWDNTLTSGTKRTGRGWTKVVARSEKENRQRAPLWLAGLLVLNLGLMSYDAQDQVTNQRMIRVWMQAAAAPFQRALSGVGGAGIGLFQRIGNLRRAASENEAVEGTARRRRNRTPRGADDARREPAIAKPARTQGREGLQHRSGARYRARHVGVVQHVDD